MNAVSPEVQWAVLSFHENDKLRFMSNSDNKEIVVEGINKILEASGQIQRGPEDYWKAMQWKLKGNPFYGSKFWLGMDLRLMVHHLTKILKLLHSEGWRLVASADVSAKMHHGHTNQHNHEESYPLDTHSWFLLHDPNMEQEVRVDMESLTDQFAVEQITSESKGWF